MGISSKSSRIFVVSHAFSRSVVRLFVRSTCRISRFKEVPARSPALARSTTIGRTDGRMRPHDGRPRPFVHSFIFDVGPPSRRDCFLVRPRGVISVVKGDGNGRCIDSHCSFGRTDEMHAGGREGQAERERERQARRRPSHYPQECGGRNERRGEERSEIVGVGGRGRKGVERASESRFAYAARARGGEGRGGAACPTEKCLI